MDLSKLPKLSETKPPSGAGDAGHEPLLAGRLETGVAPPSVDAPRAGAEAWISIALGVILIFMCPRPLEYLFSRGHPESFTWTFTDANGNPMAYPQTAFFLPDVGIVAFGIVLVLDGLLLAFVRSARFVWFTLAITVIVTVLNLIAIVTSMKEIGFQLLPALAVAFGIYMAAYQWRLAQAHRVRAT